MYRFLPSKCGWHGQDVESQVPFKDDRCLEKMGSRANICVRCIEKRSHVGKDQFRAMSQLTIDTWKHVLAVPRTSSSSSPEENYKKGHQRSSKNNQFFHQIVQSKISLFWPKKGSANTTFPIPSTNATWLKIKSPSNQSSHLVKTKRGEKQQSW